MQLKVLGSSSTRNGYVLTNGSETLLIECGVKLPEVKKSLDYDMSSIVGCIVSHSHNDHAGYLQSYLKAGIRVLGSRETFDKKKIEDYRYLTKVILPGKGYKLGNFKIIPFELSHDVKCYGYLVEHPDMGKMVFITDTNECDYYFEGLNHIMIEANYADDILEKNIIEGRVSAAMRPRLRRSHFELETCKETIQSFDISNVINIILIHLSNGNSNEKRFEDEIRNLTGKMVYVADKGLTLNMNKTLY